MLSHCPNPSFWYFYSLDRIETNRPSSALASQSLSVVSELIPYVRETFRRHLNQAEAVLLVDFDKLKRASGPFHELFSLSFRHTLVLVWQYSAAPIQVTSSHLTRKSLLACFCAVVVHFSHKLSTWWPVWTSSYSTKCIFVASFRLPDVPISSWRPG